MVRPEKVETMVHACLRILSAEPTDTTSGEIYSTVLTLMNYMVMILLRLGMDPEALRMDLNRVAAQIPSESKVVH